MLSLKSLTNRCIIILSGLILIFSILSCSEGSETEPPPNRPPVAVSDIYFAFWNEPLQVQAPGLLANDSDPDHDQLEVDIYYDPHLTEGTVTLHSNGSFTYVPPENFEGTASFIYRIEDAELASDTATVYIIVTPNVGEDFTFSFEPDTLIMKINEFIIDTLPVTIYRSQNFTEEIDFSTDIGQCGVLGTILTFFNPNITSGNSTEMIINYGSEPIGRSGVCPVQILGTSVPSGILKLQTLTVIVTNWFKVSVGQTPSPLDMYFFNSNAGYLIGNSDIYYTSNGGQSWMMQNSGTSELLLAVDFINTNIGMVVGSNGTALKTTDAGQTWTQLNTGSTGSFRGVALVDTDTAVIVSSYNEVLRTTDAGQSWTSLYVSSAGLNSIAKAGEINLHAIGDNGSYLRSTDAGQTWNEQTIGGGIQLNKIDFLDINTGIVVGIDGLILSTTDGGDSWNQQVSNTAEVLWDVSMSSTLDAVAVGNNGTILRTTDGGSTWYEEYSGTDYRLDCVNMIDNETGYADGGSQTVLKREGL